MELSGESFQGKLFITNFVLGSMPVFTVVVSWLCIYYAVNYYMGKRNLGRSAAKGWENIREFDTACSVYTCCSCKYLLLFVSVFFLCIFVSLHFFVMPMNEDFSVIPKLNSVHLNNFYSNDNYHFLHHPLLLLSSTPGSELIFSTNFFLHSSSTFPPTRLTPRSQAVFRFSRACRF